MMVGHKILIADGNPFVRRVIRHFLPPDEFQILEADNGATALEHIKHSAPDLVILEEYLLDSGGEQVSRFMGEAAGARPKGLILLREHLSEGEKPHKEPRASHRGIAHIAVLLKPIEADSLRKAIKTALAPYDGEVEPTALDDVSAASSSSLAASLIAVEFSDHDFIRFQEFLMTKVGLFFDVKRKADLARALSRRMKSLGQNTYAEYFDYLNHSSFEEKELKNLILHLTIGETTFFRSPDQFAAFRGSIIPQLVSRKGRDAKPRLKIWSAGCSTGEEPYSIAITLKENLPDFNRWDITIHATDINHKFLKFAERGIYPDRKIRFVSEDILARYFRFDGDGYVVDPSLRQYIRFEYQNLSDENFGGYQGVDVIFCRNVLIYFKRDRIRTVIDRFRKTLGDGGFLILGYSETLFQISEDFESIHYGDAFFYRRLSAWEREEIRRKNGATENAVREFLHNRLSIIPQAPPVQQVDRPAKPPLPPETLPNLIGDRADKAGAPVIPIVDNLLAFGAIRELPSEEPPLALPMLPDIRPASHDTELSLWEEGMAMYFQEKFYEAEKIFTKIGVKYHTSARAKLGQAFIHANNGEDELAKEMLQKAISLDDLLPEAYYLRALLSEKDGNLENAIRDYRNVILLDQEFVMAHFNLAILYLKRGLVRDSRREFANTLNILKKYEASHKVKFSGGLHREALMQLCQDMER